MSVLSAFIGMLFPLSPVGDDVDAVEDANARVIIVVGIAARICRRAMDRNMDDGFDDRSFSRARL